MYQPGKDPQLAPGQERRAGTERRKTADRREEIRFEMKDPRRSGRDRRCHEGWDERVLR